MIVLSDPGRPRPNESFFLVRLLDDSHLASWQVVDARPVAGFRFEEPSNNKAHERRPGRSQQITAEASQFAADRCLFGWVSCTAGCIAGGTTEKETDVAFSVCWDA